MNKKNYAKINPLLSDFKNINLTYSGFSVSPSQNHLMELMLMKITFCF